MDFTESVFALLHTFLMHGTDKQDLPFLLAVTAMQQIIPFTFGKIAFQEKCKISILGKILRKLLPKSQQYSAIFLSAVSTKRDWFHRFTANCPKMS